MPHLLVTNGSGEDCKFPAPLKKHFFPKGESLHKDVEQVDANAIVQFFQKLPSLHCSLLTDEQVEGRLNAEKDTAVDAKPENAESQEAKTPAEETEKPAEKQSKKQSRSRKAKS